MDDVGQPSKHIYMEDETCGKILEVVKYTK